MPRLNKRYYLTSTGERKLNCYQIILPKDEVYKAGLNEKDDLIVVAEKDKLIIKKK